MRKATRNILLLAVFVVVLGFAMRAELQREEGMAPLPLTHHDPANIKALDVHCADCRTRRFERRVSGWWMLEPYPLRANGEAVTRLAAIATAPVRRALDANDYDLKKLGLDPPTVTLNVDGTVVDVGGEDPIEHDRYARTDGHLVRVPDRFGARLLEAPEVEIDPRLIDADAVVVEVVIGTDAPRADLAQAWKSAAAVQMQRGEKSAVPSTPIRVELADGKPIAFSIRRENEHYVVTRTDIGLDYLVGEGQAQALLGKTN